MIKIVSFDEDDYKTGKNCRIKVKKKFESYFTVSHLTEIEGDNIFIINVSNEANTEVLKNTLDLSFEELLKYKNESVYYHICLSDVKLDLKVINEFPMSLLIRNLKKSTTITFRISSRFINLWGDWKSKWHPDYIIEKLQSLENSVAFIRSKRFYMSNVDKNDEVNFIFNFSPSESIKLAIESSILKIKDLEQELTNLLLLGNWDLVYEKDEKLFSKNFITPLLKKMKFDNITYSHGIKEYGRDFIFSEINRFGEVVNYGLQVKAGNISGKVNSEIDEIIGQIEDAFSMPFIRISNSSSNYISVFIVAISGKFSNNAKEKIMNKVKKGLHGAIYFWDKEKIIELSEKEYE